MLKEGTVLLLGLAFSWAASAGPITYTITARATGTIGGSAFTNALVQVTASGDTANVVSLLSGGYEYFVNVPSTTTVTIAGIGTATVTGGSEPGVSPNPVGVFSFPTPISLAPAFPVQPYVVIGTLDNPPALSSFTAFGLAGSNALLGYDLRTSIGPIAGIPGGVDYAQGLFIHTTLGNLSFTEVIAPTSEGTFAATEEAPEPSSLLLTSIGLCGAVAAGRVRRSHS